MCGGGSTKVKNETKLPWYQEQTGGLLFRRGSEEIDRPYVSYPGNRVAGFAPEQESAFANIIANQGSWEPLFGQATAATQAGAQRWTEPGVAESYMSPYWKNATDVAARELERDFGIQGRLRRGRAAEMGSWGGSQAGVAEAAAERDYRQQLADLYATGADRAFGQGLQAFGADRAAQQQTGGALAQLASQRQQLGFDDARALAGVGAERRGLEQSMLDDLTSRWNEQRDWNKNNLAWLASLMGSTPAPTSSTQSQSGGSNLPGQIFGGLQSLGSLGLLGYLAASDRQLKTDIERIGTGVRGLPLYSFRYKSGGDRHIGYMADEVKKVAPWAVVRVGDYDFVCYGLL